MPTLTLQELKNLDYSTVDFYLSKSCNKSCHYCTAWTLEMRNLTVDMDFLRKTVEYLSPYKTRVCLLGGEPGLIKNLDEVIAEIKKHPNLVVQVLSNSLIRKFYPHILEDPEIIYIEHLVLDFHEDRIEKLGNYDFIPENDKNNYNLIIQTPNYFKYRENFDLSVLDHKNTEFKEYNSRSPTYNIVKKTPEADRKLCAKFPLVPVFDFELQKIRHCSRKVIEGSRQFEVNKENVDKMMNYELFEFEEYCKTCTDQSPPNAARRVINFLTKNTTEIL
jgi:organic radical activating enzyme